jgi:hypothetical protein
LLSVPVYIVFRTRKVQNYIFDEKSYQCDPDNVGEIRVVYSSHSSPALLASLPGTEYSRCTLETKLGQADRKFLFDRTHQSTPKGNFSSPLQQWGLLHYNWNKFIIFLVIQMHQINLPFTSL